MRFSFEMPFWHSHAVQDEPLLIMEQAAGQCNGYLLCEPEGRLTLCDAYGAQYIEGQDYSVRGAEVSRLPGSRMPVLTLAEYMPSEPCGNSAPYRIGGGEILYTEGRFLVDKQVRATYRFKEPVRRFVSEAHGSKQLVTIVKRLYERLPVRVALLGDSLGEGCNCSQMLNQYPYTPPWYTRFLMRMVEKYHAPVEMPKCFNLSKGGELSDYGVRRAEDVASLSPNLLVIEFGSNDGTFNVSPDLFQANIRTIMETVGRRNPACGFILCTPLLANPDTVQCGCQAAYLAPLLALEREFENTVVADFLTPHAAMFAGGKRPSDLSANNINHPNDFVIQMMADVMAELF